MRLLSEPALHVKAPNIRRLMRNGISAAGVVGVAPSDSWPAHAARTRVMRARARQRQTNETSYGLADERDLSSIVKDSS